jgi:hypothetical protein
MSEDMYGFSFIWVDILVIPQFKCSVWAELCLCSYFVSVQFFPWLLNPQVLYVTVCSVEAVLLRPSFFCTHSSDLHANAAFMFFSTRLSCFLQRSVFVIMYNMMVHPCFLMLYPDLLDPVASRESTLLFLLESRMNHWTRCWNYFI